MGYKGFQTEANSHEIQCEHHLVAGLFVCKKSVLAWDAGLPGRRGRRPLHSLAGANICNLGRREKLNINDVNAAVNVYTQTK